MIATFGDSVLWGQGLVEQHKFDRIVAGADGQLSRPAHSGSLLGTMQDHSTESDDPEVPLSYPSIWQQVLNFSQWADVDWAIVNGGINDVSLGKILDPWGKPEEITQLTQRYCGDQMRELLIALGGRLTKPGAHVLVMGYYPMVSEYTEFQNVAQPKLLMQMHGVQALSQARGALSDKETLKAGIVENTRTFWHASEKSMSTAVDDANAAIGRTACIFVPSPLKEENALWGPEEQLWAINDLLEPTDEVRLIREAKCKLVYNGVLRLVDRIRCDHASIGHPNVEGAARMAGAVKAVMAAHSTSTPTA